MKLWWVCALALAGQTCFGQVEDMITAHENAGRMMAVITKESAEKGVNGSYLNCLRNLEAVSLINAPNVITSYDHGKMLMFHTQSPEPGYYIYRGDKSYFMKMDQTELQKFKKCSLSENVRAFEMDFGDGEVVHMQADGLVLSQSEAPSKRKVPFACSARLKDVTNSANAKLYLNDYMARQMDQAFDSFEFARKNLESEKRDYRAEAKADGSNISAMNSRHGEAIFEYARKSNSPAFREALESCKAIPAPTLQEEASLYMHRLDTAPKVLTGTGAGATR